MDLEAAPYLDDVAGGSLPGAAYWVETSDGVRIRVGHWPVEDVKGTVLLFPGRTEYMEKYAITAGELADRGYATLAIDWRGQGLADRLLDDRRVGHVLHFTDYQKDVAAALRAARQLDLPRPWHLLGHSMGGGIGLRAAMEGLPVQSCAFTGPMWGIYMSGVLRPIGWALAMALPVAGLGHRLPPSTRYENYVLAEPFEGNVLTKDAAMYDMMRRQLEAHPELALGGPSLIWFREALVETRHLASRASPDLPCICFVGEDEKIIDVERCRQRMAAWPRGELDIVEGAEHEVLMETPAVRGRVLDRMVALFSGTRDTTEARDTA